MTSGRKRALERLKGKYLANEAAYRAAGVPGVDEVNRGVLRNPERHLSLKLAKKMGSRPTRVMVQPRKVSKKLDVIMRANRRLTLRGSDKAANAKGGRGRLSTASKL